MGQANFWELFVLLEINEDERPREGWKVYENTPLGRKVVTTRRGKALKFSKIRDFFEWAGEHRRGYQISMDGYGYGGLLKPTKG
jgi:hypothetical protein